MRANQFSLLKTRRFLPLFLAQGLAALNDGLLRSALVATTATAGVVAAAAPETQLDANLALVVFMLPFVVFSGLAGEWGDRTEKSRAIRFVRLLGIGVMAVAAACLWLPSIAFGAVVLFLAGTCSALFGPLKYAILPQALRSDELIGGNALVASGTVVLILLGALVMVVISPLSPASRTVLALVLPALAVAAWMSARFIPATSTPRPRGPVDWNVVAASRRCLGELRGQPAVRYAVLGICWFWFVGAVFLLQLPAFASASLGGDASVAAMLMALIAVGLCAGSLLCEVLSRRTVEIGLVPLGALGLTVFGLDLCLGSAEAAAVSAPVAWRSFMSAPSNLRTCIDAALIGVSGGLFLVPLQALVQQRAPRQRLARVIAASNILNAIFVIAAAALMAVLLRAGIAAPQLLLATVLLNAIVATYIFILVPEFAARFFSWIVIRLLYRLDVRGMAHVPDEGPALVVCNHVSYMDALLVMGSVPRPVRFVMYYRIFRIPVLNLVFRAARAIPIAGAKEDPRVMERAFAEVDAALARGEVVGIFPEGRLTSDGEIAQFRRGVEQMLERRPVPVVPMALRGMWRSMWSRRDSAVGRMRLPRRFRARVELVAAVPVAGMDATAQRLEHEVRSLRGDRA